MKPAVVECAAKAVTHGFIAIRPAHRGEWRRRSSVGCPDCSIQSDIRRRRGEQKDRWMDQRMKERTRAEWRELGFFYDLNHNSKEWLLMGSRAGLLRFSELLRAYATNPHREGTSEHDHYGPYMYLKVMTWPHAGIDANTIHGSLEDLGRSRVAG
jgi:hypothetical protein